jgi:hypothetical protein
MPSQPAILPNPVPTVETRDANQGGADTLSPEADTTEPPSFKDCIRDLVVSYPMTKIQSLLHA